MNHPFTYVEFGWTGHRSIYIKYLSEDFLSNAPGCLLNIWVSDRFLSIHCELVKNLSRQSQSSKGKLVFNRLENIAPGVAPGDYREHASIIRRCISEDSSRACFIPYLDSVMRPLAIEPWKRMGCPFSGLLFQPFLHYNTFAFESPESAIPVKRYAKAYLLNKLFFSHPDLIEVLTLDPYAPAYYNSRLGTRKMRYLTDYLVETPPFSSPREHFNVPANKTIIAFFGRIDRRKGCLNFLSGLRAFLNSNPSEAKRVGVAFVGQVDAPIAEEFESSIEEIKTVYPDLWLMIENRFLSNEEVSTFFEAADVVCALYPKHTGMSGQLTLAARHRCLVLGSRHGLLGELIRRFDLGEICDATDSLSVAKGIGDILRRARSMTPEDFQMLRLFAARYSSVQFGKEVRECLLRTAGLQWAISVEPAAAQAGM